MADAAGSSLAAPIRAVLVDDHQMVLDGLCSMLRPHAARVEVVGQATDAAAAADLVGTLSPDVVLLDVRLRGASGLDLCQELLAGRPVLRVVFLTVYDDEQYLFQALRAGASGFLLKRVTGPELVSHLERVMDGEIAIDPALMGRVALSAARLHSGEYWPGAHLGLTHRESEVLEQMVRGLSHKAIAAKLMMGEETVKTHARAVYRKLGAADRSQAIATALREGLFH
ncbi:MAG TPA: response regulator transcription factor [Acidimicrobiales bacterium]|nr:response regulator transcription factor [Acidimicrobiales bacterium]